MKGSVFVSRKLPDIAIEKLKSECDVVEINPYDRSLSREELINFTKGKTGLISMLHDRIDREFLDNLKDLKAIANYAVGYNNIDIAEVKKRGIPVSNTPDVLTKTTAELTWALIFAVARRICEADRYIRADKWKEWGPMQFLGHDINGKTLGIIGAGRIGTAVGKMSKAFDMDIIYHDSKSRCKELEDNYHARMVNMDTLLKESDFITIHVPLTEDTHHLITEIELKKMKSGAFLINASRGQVIKEVDLMKGLRDKVIAGAGLDVYEFEPKITKELYKLDNVVLTPHIGSATHETRTKMAMMAVDNMIAMLKGKRAPNSIY
jgi:glyoxylate reductase